MKHLFGTLVFILFLNEVFAQNWGTYSYYDKKIVDFSFENLKWKTTDGESFGFQENASLPLPTSVQTEGGKKIPLQDLGYDSFQNKLVFTALTNGKKFPIYKKVNELGLNAVSLSKLGKYLVSIENNNGRKLKGFLLEYHQILKTYTLLQERKKLFKNSDNEIGKIEFGRKTHVLPIASLSLVTQTTLRKIHDDRYKSLLKIAAEITEKKIKFFEQQEQNNPIDEKAENQKVIENSKLIEERNQEIFIIKQRNEEKLRPWQKEYEMWEKEKNDF